MRRATSLASAVARDAGGRLFGVFWGSLVVIDLGRICHVPHVVTMVGIVLVVAVASLRQPIATALAAAGVGWLFVNGFLVNDLGVLRWEGTGDLWRLLVFVAVACAAARTAEIDGFLTLGRRKGSAPRVRSHDAPGHPEQSVRQEKHAVRG